MTFDIPDEDVPLLIEALEHYYAYTVAREMTDPRFQEYAEMLSRKSPSTGREKATGEEETGLRV